MKLITLILMIILYKILVNSISIGTYIIVILGCHIDYIQNDRIETAINFTNTLDKDSNIIWFLTGGVKNNLDNIVTSESEAIKMANKIQYNSNWKFVIEDKAINTAQNMLYFYNWLQINKYSNSNVIMVTSKFHYNRANKIADGIIPDLNIQWILGKKSCSYCNNDEKIHIKNVEKDIELALKNKLFI